jgi:hypothetical protein
MDGWRPTEIDVNENSKTNDTGGRIASLEGMFHDFLAADREWKSEITRYIQKIDEKASNAGRTDLATLAVWATVVLAIIGLVATPIGIFLLREADRNGAAIEALDAKLQREMNLTSATTDAKIENNQKTIFFRHDALQKQVDRQQDIQDRELQANSDELRRWRNGELHRQ